MNLRCLLLMMLLSASLAVAAHSNESLQFGSFTAEQFQDYWYNRGAEISRFELQQLRYGELHESDAILLFVTEKMNPDIQVKADNPQDQDIPVLKLNAVRKFFTGIYPYSILTSTFAPVDIKKYPLPLKISFSAQEWCGHVYMQMNLRPETYRIRAHSYFEKEGDRDFNIEQAIPEDAIWTMIRLSPASLPQGAFSMIPATLYSRFQHRQLTPEKVFGKLIPANEKSLEGKPLVIYEISFQEAQRNLRIFFEKDFPYRIQKWLETVGGLSGTAHQASTTGATRTHTIQTAYWRQHGNRDRAMLKKLGLGTRELGR